MAALSISSTLSAQAQRYRVLSHFSRLGQGSALFAGLVQDAEGNLYGTTTQGGVYFFGTIFKIARSGAQITLYNFTGDRDGTNSYYPMVLDAAGNLYGSTLTGGAHGDGTVFKLDRSGIKTTLHDFDQSQGDGRCPTGLVLDQAGNIHGTAAYGGNGRNGIVFELLAGSSWSEVVRYAFSNGSDGSHPSGSLALDDAGNLYGTTEHGGAHSAGTIYKLGADGTETILHSFTAQEGGNPKGLIRDAAGNLYGTAENDGAYGYGAVFRLDASGTFSSLYQFSGGKDGGNPYAGLVQGPAGELYGTTNDGGDLPCDWPYGCGVVFRVDQDGRETVLHAFSGSGDGAFVWSGLVLDRSGKLYGTTLGGGSTRCAGSGCGTVFEVEP